MRAVEHWLRLIVLLAGIGVAFASTPLDREGVVFTIICTLGVVLEVADIVYLHYRAQAEKESA